MASASPKPHQFQVISRRARALIQKHARPEDSPGGGGGGGGNIKAGGPSDSDAPWPKSIRYGFYGACVAAVPFSACTAIALSPRVREWILPDDALDNEQDEAAATSRSRSSRALRFVRRYWGHEDYVPPVDRPAAMSVVPGRVLPSQESNWESAKALLGMSNSPPAEDWVPMSLDNEPPAYVRRQQTLLARSLSPSFRPQGIRTRLSLVPTDAAGQEQACFREVLSFPADAAVAPLREKDSTEYKTIIQATKLANLIGAGSEGGNYRLALDFEDDQEPQSSSSATISHDDDISNVPHLSSATTNYRQESTAQALRQNTSIHSLWTYFPEIIIAGTNNVSTQGLRSSSSTSSSASLDPNQYEIQKVRHQIESLQNELRDPSSLRNRDDMQEELMLAKQKLRELEPRRWWRRILG